MNETPHLPSIIRQARLQRGFTQEQLAEQLHVTSTTIGAWEKGHTQPSLSIRPLIEAVLGISFVEEHSEQPQALEPLLQEWSSPKPSRSRKGRSRLDENRRRMLQRVQSFWIEGVLKQVLSHATPIMLRFQERPDAVENPWQDFVQESTLPSQMLPPETSIVTVFERADGTLLILGEPGVGKTTLLLGLARTLLQRAQQNGTHPIPVIFNLAGWAEKQFPLANWLIEELNLKYQVPRALARTWVANNQLALLLDGLDEIAEIHRANCILAINRYRSEHGMVSIVVCSRNAAYFATPKSRLLLNTAVMIQPLTPQQIEGYISSGGERLAGLRTAFHLDPVLREAVNTPLMLTACSFVYEHRPAEEISSMSDQQEQRGAIIEQYITQIWHRGHAVTPHYPVERVMFLLGWLAQQMRGHGQGEFYLERIQPDWLEEEKIQMLYQKWVARLLLCISFFVQATLFACFRGDTEPDVPGLFFWLGSHAHGNSILGWMAPGVGGGLGGGGSLGLMIFVVQALVGFFVEQTGSTKALLRAILHNLFGMLRVSLLIGGATAILVIAALALLQNSLLYGIEHGIGIGIYAGLSFGLIWLIARGEEQGPLQKRVRPLKRSFGDRLFDTALYFFSGFLGMFWWYALQAGSPDGNPFRAALCVGLGVAVMWGPTNMTERLIKVGIVIRPAEVARWNWKWMAMNVVPSFKRGIALGTAIALPTIMILLCMSSLFQGFSYAWRYGLIYGLIVGCVNGSAAMLTSLLNSGWSSALMPDLDQYRRPNEGMHRSFRNAFFAAGLFGPLGGIISGICCGLCFWVAGVPGWFFLMLGLGLVSGIGFALQFWNAYGGRAWIEHYLLRWFLWRKHTLPWRSSEYLDEAVRRTLLRKIGSGYAFSHHLFLDYFARWHQ